MTRLFDKCRIVPREATDEMLDMVCSPEPSDRVFKHDNIQAVFKEMLSASPHSPLEEAIEDLVKYVRVLQSHADGVKAGEKHNVDGAYLGLKSSLARLDAITGGGE